MIMQKACCRKALSSCYYGLTEFIFTDKEALARMVVFTP